MSASKLFLLPRAALAQDDDVGRFSMYRPLNEYERMIIGHILSQEFPGKEFLARQIPDAKVQSDGDGYVVRFASPSAFEGIAFRESLPLETFYPDLDGIMVHAMLGVTKLGQIVSLEFYRDDGGDILSRATLDKLQFY